MGYERPVVASSLSDDASGTSSRSKRSCLPTEKIVVFAPIPSASDEAAMIVNPRLLRSTRAATTRSDQIPSMEGHFTPQHLWRPAVCPDPSGLVDPFVTKGLRPELVEA